jgi:type IV pilus assembly protein PilF
MERTGFIAAPVRGGERMPRAVLIAALALAGACAGPVSDAKQQSGRIHHDLGVNALEHGDLRGALRELLIAVDEDPNNPQAQQALGLVFHAMGRPKDALEHYEKALELKPAYSEAHNNLGTLLLDLGRHDEAIEHFKKALADILYQTPSLAEGNLGWAYYRKGDADKARLHLRNAVAQNARFCRGYLWLARIGVDRSEPAEVIVNGKRFEKHCQNDAAVAKTLPPEYVREMQYYLGMGYLKQGDRDAARKSFATCAVVDAPGEYAPRCVQSLRALE